MRGILVSLESAFGLQNHVFRNEPDFGFLNVESIILCKKTMVQFFYFES